MKPGDVVICRAQLFSGISETYYIYDDISMEINVKAFIIISKHEDLVNERGYDRYMTNMGILRLGKSFFEAEEPATVLVCDER